MNYVKFCHFECIDLKMLTSIVTVAISCLPSDIFQKLQKLSSTNISSLFLKDYN